MLLSIATTALSILTSCGKPTPKIEPRLYKVHKLKKCGKLKYERQGDKLILDYKVARCLKNNLVLCCRDKKALEVCNNTNIEYIKMLKEYIDD